MKFMFGISIFKIHSVCTIRNIFCFSFCKRFHWTLMMRQKSWETLLSHFKWMSIYTWNNHFEVKIEITSYRFPYWSIDQTNTRMFLFHPLRKYHPVKRTKKTYTWLIAILSRSLNDSIFRRLRSRKQDKTTGNLLRPQQIKNLSDTHLIRWLAHLLTIKSVILIVDTEIRTCIEVQCRKTKRNIICRAKLYCVHFPSIYSRECQHQWDRSIQSLKNEKRKNQRMNTSCASQSFYSHVFSVYTLWGYGSLAIPTKIFWNCLCPFLWCNASPISNMCRPMAEETIPDMLRDLLGV